jgi:hypothetical protein
MTQSPQRQAPAGYQLRVQGHLDDHWSAWFGDLTLTHESDGTTSLSGVVSDQAELHGLLMKVRDLGVTLISVEVIDPSGPGARIGLGEASQAGDKPVEAHPETT